ncbi:MAG: hypothetical protein RR547_08675 [Raoultibacter sp.]
MEFISTLSGFALLIMFILEFASMQFTANTVDDAACDVARALAIDSSLTAEEAKRTVLDSYGNRFDDGVLTIAVTNSPMTSKQYTHRFYNEADDVFVERASTYTYRYVTAKVTYERPYLTSLRLITGALGINYTMESSYTALQNATDATNW